MQFWHKTIDIYCKHIYFPKSNQSLLNQLGAGPIQILNPKKHVIYIVIEFLITSLANDNGTIIPYIFTVILSTRLKKCLDTFHIPCKYNPFFLVRRLSVPVQQCNYFVYITHTISSLK